LSTDIVLPETLGAFTGKIAYVDLTTRQIDVRPLPAAWARDYLGSTGINTRILADLAGPAGTTWDADNPIIVGVGPLVGTLLPGASRTSITTRSPITGGYGHSNSGSFGDKLKSAGFDHVAITGIADEPVVLVCDNGEIRIEPAADAWGKDIYDATDALWARYPGSGVAAIGPAGENKAVAATVLTDKHGAFGSSGLGCAFGIKRLKAIVARGEASVQVANRSRYTRQCLRLFKELMAQPHVMEWRQWGTLVQFSGANPAGATELREEYGFDIESWLQIYKSDIWRGPASCPGCPVGCKAKIRNGDHDLQISCPTGTLSLHFGVFQGAKTDRWKGLVGNAEMANRLGLSTIWAGQMVTWTRDMRDRGIVTDDEIGFDPVKGAPETNDQLMLAMAHRQGFGDILADAIPRAQERIGGRALDYPVRKGMLTLGYGERSGPETLGRWNGYSFSRCVDPRGPIAETAYSSITWTPGRSEQQLREYARRIAVPEPVIPTVVTGGVDGYDLARLTPYVEAYNMIIFSIGECNRPYFSRIMDVETITSLFSDATGIEHDAQSLVEAGERIVTLQRLFNTAHGLDSVADLGPEPETDPESAQQLSTMLQDYYAEHGWTARGVPTLETLTRLGLTSPADLALLDAAEGRAGASTA
jgi:aldehyde:ferredoxin oxidoreductase